MKICLVTSNTAASEPRAPRHAVAARQAFPDAEIVLIDVLEALVPQRPDPLMLKAHGILRQTVRFPTRKSDPVALAIRKASTVLGRAAFARFGRLSESVFGVRGQGLVPLLRAHRADLYIAHNADMLYPAMLAARRHRALVAFDCMEFYSDMGDGQSSIEARAVGSAEDRYLKRCALVLASSDALADILAREYGIPPPLVAYNVPPRTADLAVRRGSGLKLYWRNNVVDISQRGLGDALQALTLLPDTVRLSVQGHLPADGGQAVRREIDRLGLNGRVTVLPPFAPEKAVWLASEHDVGLCLERRGPRNHELTVSNKMFDYHMAGLAIVTSDMPSLSLVIKRSGGGLVYNAGDPNSLAKVIMRLHNSPELLATLQANARRFAMEDANMEAEIERIAGAMRLLSLPRDA